jgi:hypothetical protein
MTQPNMFVMGQSLPAAGDRPKAANGIGLETRNDDCAMFAEGIENGCL